MGPVCQRRDEGGRGGKADQGPAGKCSTFSLQTPCAPLLLPCFPAVRFDQQGDFFATLSSRICRRGPWVAAAVPQSPHRGLFVAQVTIVNWKLTRGKFRPLMHQVLSNSEKSVEEVCTCTSLPRQTRLHTFCCIPHPSGQPSFSIVDVTTVCTLRFCPPRHPSRPRTVTMLTVRFPGNGKGDPARVWSKPQGQRGDRGQVIKPKSPSPSEPNNRHPKPSLHPALARWMSRI